MKTLFWIILAAVLLLAFGFVTVAAIGGGALFIKLANKVTPAADKIHKIAKNPIQEAKATVDAKTPKRNGKGQFQKKSA